MITKFTKGMVYWVNLPDCYGDNVITGKRPCIIVSNNVGNVFSENITVVPCTTNMYKDNSQSTHYTTRITKDTDSVVLCENILTVSKKLTENFIGMLDEVTMEEIDKRLKIALQLIDIPTPLKKPTETQVTETQEEPERTTEDLTKKINTKALQKKYMKDYEEYGVDYVVTKYAVASRSAAYQRYNYYKRRF